MREGERWYVEYVLPARWHLVLVDLPRPVGIGPGVIGTDAVEYHLARHIPYRDHERGDEDSLVLVEPELRQPLGVVLGVVAPGGDHFLGDARLFSEHQQVTLVQRVL